MSIHRNDISRNSLGARSELLASADLVDRGWNVYRAVASDNECDLVITRGRHILRVEVRTGTYSQATGNLQWPKRPVDGVRSDIYAVVAARNGVTKITYVPELPVIGLGRVEDFTDVKALALGLISE